MDYHDGTQKFISFTLTDQTRKLTIRGVERKINDIG